MRWANNSFRRWNMFMWLVSRPTDRIQIGSTVVQLAVTGVTDQGTGRVWRLTHLCVLSCYFCSHFRYIIFFILWRCAPTRAMASSFLRFLDHTQRRNTVGRTPLDEWSARSRDLYLTTHNTHNRQTSMPPVGFEPTISAGERPQTYALDRAATGTGLTFRRLMSTIVDVPHR